MPTYNLAETVHNKWLQQFGNKMTCMYEVTVDDLICAFMQIANYKLWLRGGSTGKGHDFASLKLKVTCCQVQRSETTGRCHEVLSQY
jgi:hypothetical protein